MKIPITDKITFQTLELRFSQLLKISNRSKSSKFSDVKKKDFHDTLVRLVEKISPEDFSNFSDQQLFENYHVIERVFGWFEYLVNSTINQTPYEIISPLEEVLNDWIDDRDKYLLLTSLSNKRDLFAFYYDEDPKWSRQIKTYIKDNYNESIDYDIIRIVLPKFLSHDFLTAVNLYHELAHFIDWKYGITDSILLKFGLSLRGDTQIRYREHFADLFAAQYVNMASCSHLSYLTFEKDQGMYPSTSERVDLVNKFLNGKRSDLLSGIKKVVLENTKKRSLEIRYKELSKSDFNKLIPVDIKNPAELHGVFVLAWDIWLDPKSVLRKKFKRKWDLHRILNNLVEKSISNYFLLRNWKSIHVPN
jgi:hypothetical protein